MDYVDDGSGSLLNIQSMANIRNLRDKSLIARFIDIPLIAISNSTFQLKIGVLDQNGRAVKDALVLLESLSGLFSEENGLTNEQGVFTTYFTPSYIPQVEGLLSGSQEVISIKSVSKEGYLGNVSKDIIVTIYPENTISLSIKAMAFADVIEDEIYNGQPGYTYIDVLVTDSKHIPINGVSIFVETDGARMFTNTMTGLTDNQGFFRLKITATEVDAIEECRITIIASKNGFIDGQEQVVLTILPTTPVEDSSYTQNLGGYHIMTIFIVAVVVGILYSLWKKPWEG